MYFILFFIVEKKMILSRGDKKPRGRGRGRGGGGASGGGGSSVGGGSSERKSMGELRIMKDLEELDIGSLADVRADPTNMLKISVTAKPDEGFWRGGRFDFVMEIPRDYPHAPPKVKCTTEVRKESINVLLVYATHNNARDTLSVL